MFYKGQLLDEVAILNCQESQRVNYISILKNVTMKANFLLTEAALKCSDCIACGNCI